MSLHHPAVLAGHAGTALAGTLLLGLPAAAALVSCRPRMRAAGQQAALALAIPGACLVLWPGLALHALAWPPAPVLRILLPVVAALPVLLLPFLVRLARLVPGQARAARGLGAGAGARLRLLWLPQLGPAGLLGLALAAALHGARVVLHG